MTFKKEGETEITVTPEKIVSKTSGTEIDQNKDRIIIQVPQ